MISFLVCLKIPTGPTVHGRNLAPGMYKTARNNEMNDKLPTSTGFSRISAINSRSLFFVERQTAPVLTNG